MPSLQPTSKQRAVVYYRSARAEPGSTQTQREQIDEFVAEHNIEVVHEETDIGLSGLVTARPGLQRLLKNWICNSSASEFKYVLMSDMSRWGRFQNVDIIAHYECLCKLYGKKVMYVARESFKGDQRLISHPRSSVEPCASENYLRRLSRKLSQRFIQSLTTKVL